jgi:hypothetical protein
VLYLVICEVDLNALAMDKQALFADKYNIMCLKHQCVCGPFEASMVGGVCSWLQAADKV